MNDRIVLDTNVLVAAIRSRQGASFRLVSGIGTSSYTVCLSVPLFAEYESKLLEHGKEVGFGASEIGVILDYVASVAHLQEIFFLWRPVLRDPKDDMVLELAVAAEASSIVTHNVRDFDAASEFGIQVARPGEYLNRIGVNS